MQATADFHDPSTDTRLPQAAGVVHHATACDAAVDGLNTHAAAGDAPIRSFRGARQGSSAWFAGGPDGCHLGQGERQEAQILAPPAAGGPGIRRGLGPPLIMRAPRLGRTQTEDGERRLDQQHMFHRVTCLLAAITARRLRRILGTRATPFGAIVATRGEAGGSPEGDAAVVDTTNAVAAAAATPRRFASSVTDRVGASPSVRRVACRTVKRTCIH
jgi:hypothetical protein